MNSARSASQKTKKAKTQNVDSKHGIQTGDLAQKIRKLKLTFDIWHKIILQSKVNLNCDYDLTLIYYTTWFGLPLEKICTKNLFFKCLVTNGVHFQQILKINHKICFCEFF